MSEPTEVAHEAATRTAADADCSHGCHCEYRRCGEPCGECTVRAAVDAVWPLAVAEGRRQIAEVLHDHFLAEMVCDHERERNNPRCACSRVHLGWYPTVGEAVEGWIAHVLAQGVADA